jgi:hypothetical protein
MKCIVMKLHKCILQFCDIVCVCVRVGHTTRLMMVYRQIYYRTNWNESYYEHRYFHVPPRRVTQAVMKLF